jgi:hypothetical protein
MTSPQIKIIHFETKTYIKSILLKCKFHTSISAQALIILFNLLYSYSFPKRIFCLIVSENIHGSCDT